MAMGQQVEQPGPPHRGEPKSDHHQDTECRNKFAGQPEPPETANRPSCTRLKTNTWLKSFCDSIAVILLLSIVPEAAAGSPPNDTRMQHSAQTQLTSAGRPILMSDNNQLVVNRRTVIKRSSKSNKQHYGAIRPDADPLAGDEFARIIRDFNETILPPLLSDNFDESNRAAISATNQTSRDLSNMLTNMSVLSGLANSSSGNNPFNSETERYILMFVLVAEIAVFSIGLIGNGIVIAIILFFTKGNSVADVYIFNLAIADITFLAGLGFLFTTSINDHWVFGNIMCKIFMSLTALNQFASSLLLSLMSFDRYLAVCHPIFSQRYRHPKPAKLICFVLWILCFVLMIPIFIHARTDEENLTCGIFWPDSGVHERVFTLYSFCIGFLLPLVLIVVFYRCVVVKLKSTASGPMSMMNSERRAKNKRETNKRVSNLVKAIVVTYGACWLPYWIGQMLIGFSESKNHETYYAFNQVAACLTYLNSAVNPILYAFLSDSFRRRCAQFWQSVHSSQLFKHWPARNGHHQPPATQTSMAENHHHHHHHHSPHENNHSCCEENSIIDINNNNNNNSVIDMRQTKATTLGAADLEAQGSAVDGGCHLQMKPHLEADADCGGENPKATTIESNRNAQQSAAPFRKEPTKLISFRKLKFKRKKKQHSLVQLNPMSSNANGTPIGQTVLLA